MSEDPPSSPGPPPDGDDSDTLSEEASPLRGPAAPRRGKVADPLIGATLGDHRILRKLGEGGMGTVYLAEDSSLGRLVAIKVISGDRGPRDQGARVRFLREARAMATVDHPHVVRVYSYGESAGVVYLVMEYVEGESLGERIRRVGKLSVEEAVEIVLQVASALEAAAEKGIVHRDIKPSNLLLDARDRVRVADFGLAKLVLPEASSGEDSLTHAGQLVGTPHYLSPEQARGDTVDLRSDIYSLGIVLYQMLAGARPFQGTTPADVVAHHLHTPLPSLREKRPETPPQLAALVERMTDKDAGRRPGSYAELRKALEESDEPPPTWTSGSPYRGLAAFDFEHARIFFGRSRATEDVLAALKTQGASGRAFVLVLGTSGSGKSSLVRAGVLPLLVRPGTIGGVALWRRAILRPADAAGDLFDGLASALMREEALPELGADGTTAGELARLLRENPKGAPTLVKGGLSQAAAAMKRAEWWTEQPDARLVVVIDQMEELFTLEKVTPDERKGFVDALSALARSGRVWVMGTLRSDYYARCEELAELMALKEGAGQYHVGPPTPAEIGQMIRLPARAAGLAFEEDPGTQARLDEVLRDAAAGQVGNLPLLEFTLEDLYQQRTAEGLLTHAAYQRMGGVEGALAQRADAVFASLPLAVQEALPGVFRALVAVTTGEEETLHRRYAPLDSFASDGSRPLVDAFVAARLFVADRGDDGRAVVSIAHEALLHSWPRLHSFVEENRELLRVRGRVAMAAALWTEKGQPRDLLLAEGKPLEEALPLAQTPGIVLSEAERALILASETRARGRRRASQLMNVNSVGLMIGAGLIVGFYLWKVIPTAAGLAFSANRELPLAVRMLILASNSVARLSPLIIVALVVLYSLRKRIRVPESVRSGTALAVVSGVALLFVLFGFLATLFDLVVETPDWRPVHARYKSSLGVRHGDYGEAIRVLAPFYGSAREPNEIAADASLLAEAYMGLGDDDNARRLFEKAIRKAREARTRSEAPQAEWQMVGIEELARKGLAALDAESPRLGIFCLQLEASAASGGPGGGVLVASVNRGGPAWRAGLRKGDGIRTIDGAEVRNQGDLVRELRRRRAGQRVSLGVARGDESVEVSVELAEGAPVFAKGCAAGYLEDCVGLGSAYERGKGAAADLPRALALYQQVCDGGEPAGCVSLAFLHERAQGVPADVARAAALYARACEAGDPWGCNDLGVLTETGTGVPKDSARAADLLRRACAAGLPDGCNNAYLLRGASGGGFPGFTSRAHTR
jgi:TPR repeat protein/predicted Ser/Thr protein kinase